MDKNDKEALLYRLNWVLKYTEREDLQNIKNEVESLIDEVEKLGIVIPF